MKAIQVSVQITNEEKCDVRIEVNNLSREDVNEFEVKIAKDIENVINEYIFKLRDVMKEIHPETKSKITTVS